MTGTEGFIADIRTGLGFISGADRGPDRFRTLFPSEDIKDLLELIDSRSLEDKQMFINQFRMQAEPLRLNIHEAAGLAEAARKITGIIREAEPEFEVAPHVIQHDHPDLAALELAKHLGNERVLYTTSPDNTDVREQTIASYVGITAPSWGVADTATILQLTEPGRPRSTSLVPSIHIAVLRLARIVADLAELYAVLQRDPPSSSYVLITGPSKTADIESQLVHGAHGPREMHVVIVDEL